jgi:hypothetical protein
MKTIIKSLVLAMSLTALNAVAETTVKLEDDSAIIGRWKMYAEALALNREKKEVNNEWRFEKNGILKATSRDPRLDAEQIISIKYSIENGAINKQVSPGREKYETCNVVSLEGKEMVLHCKFLYYFMRKEG